MNNSFPRLIDGMCATLRTEVLSRLDDEFARGQVFGVINLLNTFKARADWSAGFLLQQLTAQQAALTAATALLASSPGAPRIDAGPLPVATPIADLLAARDAGNRHIGDLLAWVHEHRSKLAPEAAEKAEASLREAMRAEIQIELMHSPRPLFAEMSSGSGS